MFELLFRLSRVQGVGAGRAYSWLLHLILALIEQILSSVAATTTGTGLEIGVADGILR